MPDIEGGGTVLEQHMCLVDGACAPVRSSGRGPVGVPVHEPRPEAGRVAEEPA